MLSRAIIPSLMIQTLSKSDCTGNRGTSGKRRPRKPDGAWSVRNVMNTAWKMAIYMDAKLQGQQVHSVVKDISSGCEIAKTSPTTTNSTSLKTTDLETKFGCLVPIFVYRPWRDIWNWGNATIANLDSSGPRSQIKTGLHWNPTTKELGAKIKANAWASCRIASMRRNQIAYYTLLARLQAMRTWKLSSLIACLVRTAGWCCICSHICFCYYCF